MATLRQLRVRLDNARIRVRRHEFGTADFESGMVKVRALAEQVNAAMPKEEYCSIDSGVHRTRLSSGQIV